MPTDLGAPQHDIQLSYIVPSKVIINAHYEQLWVDTNSTCLLFGFAPHPTKMKTVALCISGVIF